MKKLLIVRLGGIHCGGCIARIEQTARHHGAMQFKLDYATLIANIEFSGDNGVADGINDAIRKAGYLATPLAIRSIEDETE